MDAVRRYRLTLAYHGENFHGWQRQPGLRTVQGELETWLATLSGASEAIAVTGAGRTDAGVHAEGMVAHFDGPVDLDVSDLRYRLNCALPDDMRVRDLQPVDPGFHARYSAVRKTYEYCLSAHPSPFGRDRVWFIRGEFDPKVLTRTAALAVGEHDFAGFCIAESLKPDTRCTVSDSVWLSEGDTWRYRITASRFLHQMVRLLVGTQVDIARGRWSADRITEILAARDVRLCGQAAPPHGLTLVAVEYP